MERHFSKRPSLSLHKTVWQVCAKLSVVQVAHGEWSALRLKNCLSWFLHQLVAATTKDHGDRRCSDVQLQLSIFCVCLTDHMVCLLIGYMIPIYGWSVMGCRGEHDQKHHKHHVITSTWQVPQRGATLPPGPWEFAHSLW
jgi:hypothetical protein